VSTLLATGLLILCGLGVLRVVWGRYPSAEIGLAATAGMAPLIGATVIGLLTTYAGVLGLSTRPWPFVAPVVLALSLVAVLPRPILARVRRTADHSRSGRPVGPSVVADLCVAGVAVVVGVVMLRGVSGRLVCCNDEYAIWAVRARTMSLAGHLDPRVFAGAAANYQHLDYPLLQPAVIAWGDGISGHLDDTAAHTLLVTVLLGGLLTLGGLLNRVAGPFAGTVAALLAVGTSGMLAQFGLLLTADVPLAAMSLALLAAALTWLARPDARLLAVVTVLAAGTAATKVEGALFAFSILIGCACAARTRRRATLAAIGVVVATMLPWFVWTRAHNIQSDLVNGGTLSWHHLRLVAPQSGNAVRLMVDYWPGYGWLALGAGGAAALLAWVVAPSARRLVGFLAVAWALATVGMWAQYVISAGQHVQPGQRVLDGLKAHFASSAPRVLIVPSLLLTLATPVFAGIVLRSVWRSRAAPPAVQPARNASPATEKAVASDSRQCGIAVSPAARQAESESTE
jgi:hypothetical protein